MKNVLLFILVLSALTSWASPGFELRRKGDQICKTSGDSIKTCLTAWDGQSDLMAEFKAYSQLKAKNKDQWTIDDLERAGGAVLVEGYIQEQLSAEFSKLIVHDVGVDLSAADTAGADQTSRAKIPFVAAVDWADGKQNSGTFFVEGFLAADESQPNNGEADRASLSRLFTIENVTDASPQAARARRAHFVSNKGGIRNQAQVDSATKDLIKNVIAPVVLSDVYFPINKAFGEAFGQAIGQLFEGLKQNLDKNSSSVKPVQD